MCKAAQRKSKVKNSTGAQKRAARNARNRKVMSEIGPCTNLMLRSMKFMPRKNRCNRTPPDCASSALVFGQCNLTEQSCRSLRRRARLAAVWHDACELSPPWGGGAPGLDNTNIQLGSHK